MPIGGAITQFPICPACGREGRVFGIVDWNCPHCRAVIMWDEKVNEVGEDISVWAIKTPPNEGVIEALERGEFPFAWKPPKFDPHGHAKALIEQRQAILSQDESVTVANLAEKLGATSEKLIKLGRTMGIFAEDQGSPDTQLNYNQFTKLHNMWGIAIAQHRTEPVAEDDNWQTDSAVVEAEA